MELNRLFTELPEAGRKVTLDRIAQHLSTEKSIAVNFICTHNSRRSHLCEIMFRSACKFYQLENVATYSGGTEGTALYPVVAESCARQGFTTIETQEYGQRAWKIFHHTLEDEKNAPLLFSKEYHHPNNAQEGYHAIMVCDSANEACPVVFGAKQRHSLLYVDPKHSDGSSEQADVYDNTLRTIASEMGYIVRKILELRG